MIKIIYFLDHPIQYQNPFLDKISLSSKIDLNVIYLSDFSLKPYFDEGLNKTIKFDNIENFSHKHQFIFKDKNKSKTKFLIRLIKILFKTNVSHLEDFNWSRRDPHRSELPLKRLAERENN